MGILKFESVICKDCCKCIGVCPVKSIEVKDHHAIPVERDCILCGNCVVALERGKGRAEGRGEHPDPGAARPAGRRCVCRFAGRRKSVRGASAADLPADTAGPDLYG